MYLAPIFTTATTVAASTKHSNAEWPLEEYQERRIMNALSHTSSPTALYSSEGEDEPESPSYFSDRAIFQLNAQVPCYKELTNESLRHLSKFIQPERLAINGTLMKPLLVERVSGTPANVQVREFIVQHFLNLGWHVEIDEFTDNTPFGEKTFANVIATQTLKSQVV
ncbi:unnamed protein product [Mucor hiemalis]